MTDQLELEIIRVLMLKNSVVEDYQVILHYYDDRRFDVFSDLKCHKWFGPYYKN
jgi:hypothetical protein